MSRKNNEKDDMKFHVCHNKRQQALIKTEEILEISSGISECKNCRLRNSCWYATAVIRYNSGERRDRLWH